MAIQYSEQRIIDSNKRALIKLTGLFDGNNASNVTVVDASTLAFALNSNGYIMTANTDPKSSYPLSVKRISGDVNVPLLRIQWKNDSNSDIVILGSRAVDIHFDHNGDNATIPPNGANNTGDILISTGGSTANGSYTLFLDLRKNPSAFDQGQTQDPRAFNKW